MLSNVEFVGSVKRIAIFTMCHISEFQTILDSNYIKVGVSMYVKFSLGKWLGTCQKIYSKRSKNSRPH